MTNDEANYLVERLKVLCADMTELVNQAAEELDRIEQTNTPQTELTAKCLNCHNAKACKEKHWDGCIYEPQTERSKQIRTPYEGDIKVTPHTEERSK